MEVSTRHVTPARLSGTWTTYLGAAHGVLTAAGMSDLSLADMGGLTGIAFHLFVQDRCSAASVTVYNWVGRHQTAMEWIGVLADIFHTDPDSPTYEAARRHAVGKIKGSIDNGVGVIAWAIDTGEFGVIYGYDDHDGVFLVDGVDKFNRPLGSDPMLYENIARKCPPAPFVHYQIPVERVEHDLEESYQASLKFYVDVMERTFHMSPEFHSGLKAYDVWTRSLEDGTYDPFGLRYTTTVYADSKHLAAEYVSRLVDNWKSAPSGLSRIAELFGRTSKIYNTIMHDVLEQDWENGKHLHKPVSQTQADAMSRLLREAKQIEVEAVEKVKAAMGL